MPGPADHPAPKLSRPSGGRFNEGKSKTEVEWAIYHASFRPGPADYPAPPLPRAGGGAMSEAKPKSDLDWRIYEHSQLPGPGEHKIRLKWDKGTSFGSHPKGV